MAQNVTANKPFDWSKNSSSAAFLCAEDVQADEQIAAAVGISRQTLHRWKQHPEFQARIAQHVAEIQERARAEGLGRLDKRMAAYHNRHARMTRLIEERGRAMIADEDGEVIPGGSTGLLVRQYKSIGTGPNARQVEEYHFDAALVRELRELEKQIAQDAGQWSEKREVSGPDGAALMVVLAEREDGPS